MYRNLEAEMARDRIARKDIAKMLGVRYATVIDKMNGKYGFTLDEAFRIKKTFFPNHSIEYLFGRGEDECQTLTKM